MERNQPTYDKTQLKFCSAGKSCFRGKRKQRMNLYDDESLKQEVIYLHSLWHQGPPIWNRSPSTSFNPIQESFPRSRPNYIPPADFQLLSRYGAPSPQIVSRNLNHPQNIYSNKRSRPDSGREWPGELHRSPPTGSGRKEFNSSKKSRSNPAKEKEKFAAHMLQKDIHRTCREFFDSSVTGVDVSDTNNGNEELTWEKVGSSKEFQFLSKLFEENEKLKEYYLKNTGRGEFMCLACNGTGEKSCRRFKDCLAIVQHSLNINKKDSKIQHRALALVVCNVINWDVENPVASSQKRSQTSGVKTVAEGSIEPFSDLKPQETTHVMPVDEQGKTASELQMQENASEES